VPVLHLIAGPNGAGKSSYAHNVLIPATGLRFVNADDIAARHWPDDPAGHAYEAARDAEAQRRDLMAAGESFITETVFSHPSKIDLVADASAMGYLVHLHVILVPVELAVQRVTERVRRGGHTVPETKIRQRYDRLWAHIAQAVKIADVTQILDNSNARHPFHVCATYLHGMPIEPITWPSWVPSPLAAG